MYSGISKIHVSHQAIGVYLYLLFLQTRLVLTLQLSHNLHPPSHSLSFILLPSVACHRSLYLTIYHISILLSYYIYHRRYPYCYLCCSGSWISVIIHKSLHQLLCYLAIDLSFHFLGLVLWSSVAQVQDCIKGLLDMR